MKKGRLAASIVTLCTAFALVASGCSSSSSTPAPGGKDKVEILLGYYSEPATKKKMEEIIAKFESTHPDIKVKTQTAPYDQFNEKLNTQIASGSAPDVWLSDGTLVFGFAERGAIKDLTEYVNKDLNKDDLYGLDYNKDSSGKYWAVPQGIQVAVLYYNKDLFDKAGVPYPTENWTLEDLKKAGEKLTMDASGKHADDPAFDKKNVKQYGMTVFSITRGTHNFLRAYGGTVLDPTMTQATFDTPQNRQALEWIKDGMDRKIFPNPADMKAFNGNFKAFLGGAATMQIDLYAGMIAMFEAGLNVDVVPIPSGPNGNRYAPVIANSWVINKKADDAKTQAAWEWIKYWATSDEVQNEWGTLGEAIPVKKSVANSDVFMGNKEHNINKKAFLESLKFANTMQANAVFGEWVDVMGTNVNNYYLGTETLDGAVTKTQDGIQKALDKFYKKK